jgi:methylmalonyl-CoA mutase C-terminal domain/subunit
MTLVPRVLEELRARGIEDAVIWVGGIIPAEDVTALRALGVGAVFGPGSSLQSTIDFVREAVAGRRAQLAGGEA